MFFWTQTLHFPGTTTAAQRRINLIAAGKVAAVEENRVHSENERNSWQRQASHDHPHHEKPDTHSGAPLSLPGQPKHPYLSPPVRQCITQPQPIRYRLRNGKSWQQHSHHALQEVLVSIRTANHSTKGAKPQRNSSKPQAAKTVM